MPELNEYKCPACGGAMEFDSESQKMKCPYCDTELDVSAFAESEEKAPAEEKGGNWESQSKIWDSSETEGMNVYLCESCGGEIVADATTGASSCPFCGNRVVMKGKFSGDLKPDYIIPFKLNKKAAKEAYKKHLQGKKFLPKVFSTENHIDEIKGVYVPFWLYDLEAEADISYRAENVRRWRDKRYEYTEIKSYACRRAGSISFEHLPCDASRKMDDKLMESIEPYDFEGAVPFKNAYMAGYMADRYDVDMESRKLRAAERAKKSAELSMAATVGGYSSVRAERSSVNIRDARYCYALYPVWLLNSSWKGEKFTFAMNGQTGKMVGNLPVDNKAFWLNVLMKTGIFSAAVYAAMAIFMNL